MRPDAVLLSLLCSAAAAQDIPGATERAALVRLAGSVLRVEAPGTNGQLAVGSAVTVAAERVVTNCHVTRDARKVFVIRSGVRWEAQSQAADIERDLCLLHVPGLVSPAVPMGAASTLAIGERVAAIGYTGGAMVQRGLGGVVELHRHDGGRVIKSSSWFSSGASGGGLFDGRGALVGVLTFRLRGGDAHWFAAPVEWVRQLLDDPQRAPEQPVRPLPTSLLPYWQQPLAQQPRFLRAAVMQRDAAWSELGQLARDWLAEDDGDAEPWQLLGTALEQLNRVADALHAFDCAQRLAPEHPLLRSKLLALRERTAGNEAAACKAGRR
jgi:hypothetical protein